MTALPAAAAEAGRPVPVEFHGRTGEWFGIWIVNLLLSILTLGIYSAWAKVRHRKYFAQHTTIAGRSFDYHASGRQILIGRLIVLAGFIVYSILGAIPVLAFVMPLLLLLLIPFLLVRALRFNARVTSWANVRFGFDGGTGRAFLVYILYPILGAFSLYLAWPFVSRAIRRYSIGHHRLGGARFSFDCGIGPFYRAFLAALLAFVLLMVLVGGLVLGPALARLSTGDDAAGNPLLSLLPAVLVLVALVPAAAIYGAFLRNPVFASTRIGGVHQLHSDVAPLRLVWIILSNAVAVVLSLGLLLPWAQIRSARYLAAHTAVIPGGSLDDFIGAEQPGAGPVGDALADLEGWDVGLPV
jgi:uncharacterized membrane protein YjgN (DUF898 family)